MYFYKAGLKFIDVCPFQENFVGTGMVFNIWSFLPRIGLIIVFREKFHTKCALIGEDFHESYASFQVCKSVKNILKIQKSSLFCLKVYSVKAFS